MGQKWMKLILALGVLAALVTSALAASALGIYGDGGEAEPHAISDCSCGGTCVVRERATGGKEYVKQWFPCPDNRDYNCREYRYEYIRTYECNRCGALLARSEFFYVNCIDHLH